MGRSCLLTSRAHSRFTANSSLEHALEIAVDVECKAACRLLLCEVQLELGNLLAESSDDSDDAEEDDGNVTTAQDDIATSHYRSAISHFHAAVALDADAVPSHMAEVIAELQMEINGEDGHATDACR